jgi:hypothetical protein
MNDDDLKIPLLDDLVSAGQVNEEQQTSLTDDENIAVEIDAYEEQNQSAAGHSDQHDELTDDASVKELLIDEEIRLILDKHMDHAYEEIIRLLNHKIS